MIKDVEKESSILHFETLDNFWGRPGKKTKAPTQPRTRKSFVKLINGFNFFFFIFCLFCLGNGAPKSTKIKLNLNDLLYRPRA